MSIPTDGPASSAASVADEALRAQAAAALGAAAPALLVRADGRLLAANPAGRALLGARELGELAPVLSRLAPTLRPGRAPRLERLRLPGRLTPTTFACSLIAADGARALLMTSLDAARPLAAASTEPQSREPRSRAGGDALPAGIAPSPPRTEPERPAPPALTFSFPLRFTWQTDADARLSHVDPRLATALGMPAESLRGRDWRALGAVPAHEAVLAGRSFSHLPITLTAPRGEAFAVELGGAPAREEGMRGFGVVKQRIDAAPASVPPTVIEPPVAEVSTAEPPTDTTPALAQPIAPEPAATHLPVAEPEAPADAARPLPPEPAAPEAATPAPQ
ncbi:hypothetical protein VRZ77_13140, partial [Ancylobacter sp. G4_0304]